MKIIPQPGQIENTKDQIYKVEIDSRTEQNYLAQGYEKRKRTYQITYHNRVNTIICPEFHKDLTNTILIIPEFLIPRRPYPLCVYLFAINLYCHNPKLSQRKAAVAVRKEFGLSTFAHTTLGRALKRFTALFAQESVASTEPENEGTADAKATAETPPSPPRLFPSLQATAKIRQAVGRIFKHYAFPQQHLPFPDSCCALSAKIFEIYGRLLF